MGASSRLRSYQYIPLLETEGIEICVKPFFNEKYLRKLYAGKIPYLSIIKAYFRRFLVIFSVYKYDKLVIEKEIFPYLPAVVERLLKVFKIKYIVDYDDAIFHNYDQSRFLIVRILLQNKIRTVMRNSEVVTAGNSYLANYAYESRANKVVIIPTVVDLIRYKRGNREECSKFVVGWIGTKSTFEQYLVPCKAWILEVQRLYPDLEFHIVGVSEKEDFGAQTRWFEWKEETEAKLIGQFDIGIMPLGNSKWELGKCAYKLIQYGACGVPGLASNVGMNSEIIKPGETGWLVNSPLDWMRFIIRMKENARETKAMGENARKLVEEKYSLQVTISRWMELLLT
ncbi:glycosyltransferase family 4 protein [Niabella terrae]